MHFQAFVRTALLAALVCWPALASANTVVEWDRVMLKLEPVPRLSPHTRAAALMHVAIHDAINSIPDSRRYTTYLPLAPAAAGASPEAAASAAAHWILREYVQTNSPTNTALLAEIEALYTSSLASIEDGPAKTEGINAGEAAAAALWQARANDGWNNPSRRTFTFPTPAPGVWRQVPGYPPTLAPTSYWWGDVTPWTMTSVSQFMAPPPLDITRKKFLEDVAEVQAYGSSQSTVRTADQSASAVWWAACGMGNIYLVAEQLVLDHGNDLHESARIFALMALTVADAVISNVYNKETWSFWRPVTAIHESGDTGWTPFLRTPPSQEYPAGHTMGSGAAAYVLARFFPGQLKQPVHVDSPVCGARSFNRLSDVVDDVIGARIWGGMHFRHSGEVGAALGKKIAHWVHDGYLLPLEQ
jgi:hypothetical protein